MDVNITCLIQDIDGRRLEQQHGQDEGERQEGALATGELSERCLPDTSERHLHLQSCTYATEPQERSADILNTRKLQCIQSPGLPLGQRLHCTRVDDSTSYKVSKRHTPDVRPLRFSAKGRHSQRWDDTEYTR